VLRPQNCSGSGSTDGTGIRVHAWCIISRPLGVSGSRNDEIHWVLSISSISIPFSVVILLAG